MVEGLTFLINSSNFADDIVLYCVCIRRGRGGVYRNLIVRVGPGRAGPGGLRFGRT